MELLPTSRSDFCADPCYCVAKFNLTSQTQTSSVGSVDGSRKIYISKQG